MWAYNRSLSAQTFETYSPAMLRYAIDHKMKKNTHSMTFPYTHKQNSVLNELIAKQIVNSTKWGKGGVTIINRSAHGEDGWMK